MNEKNILCLFCILFLGYCLGAIICGLFLFPGLQTIYINGLVNIFIKESVDIFVKLANITCGVVAPFTLYVSIKKHFQTVNDERRINTLSAFAEIQNKYSESKMAKYDEYLGELEYFAAGINLNIYSIDVINKMEGDGLIDEYEKITMRAIDKMKKKNSKSNLFQEYELMIRKLKEKRKI